MSQSKKYYGRRAFFGILLLLLVLLPATIIPTKSAAFAPDVVAVNVGKWTWEKIQDIYKTSFSRLKDNLISNALNTYVQNFSYTMANYVASGAIGGKPLFRTEDLGKSLNKARDAAYGDFLGELTEKHFADLGIDLCDPSLDVKLSLSLKLIDQAAPGDPKCNWREVQQNWRQFSNDLTSGSWTDFIKLQLDIEHGGVKSFNDFFDSFSMSNSDLGALAIIYEEAEKRAVEAKRIEEKYQILCQGYKDKVTVITGEVEVTCQQNKAIAEAPLGTTMAADKEKLTAGGTVKSIGDILNAGWITFRNTLSGNLMKHYIQEGMWSLTQILSGDTTSQRDDLLAILRGGGDVRRAPRDADIFRDLKTPQINEIENYSLLENFAVCPNQADFRHPDNCTISIEFLQLLPQRKTVAQAINEGLLNPKLPFIGQGDPRNNQDTCYLEGLCYHNLVKLRKAGIIPIAWEIIAQRAPLGTSVTIQKAIDCFEDGGNCNYDTHSDYAVNGVDHNPYYHLLDPNWVLKAPAARCDALVYGSVLESSESSSRQQYCADVQTCLREDGQGNCLEGQYGYCTRSENIWQFDADLCEDGEIYSGCLTFNNEDSGSHSYIEGSLEYCDADQVGCNRYAQEKDIDNNWLLAADMTSSDPLNDNDLFLNNYASNCPNTEAGCREFIIMAPSRGINLLSNGSFEEYGSEVDNNQVPPQTVYKVFGWQGNSLETSNNAYHGRVGLQVDGNVVTTFDTGVPLGNRSFILSFYAQDTPGYDPDSSNLDVKLSSLAYDISKTVKLGSSWQQYSVSGTFAEYINDTEIEIKITGNNIFLIDAVKLEEIDTFSYAQMTSSPQTNYSDYGDGGRIFLEGSRSMCLAEEVGCQGYSPLNGDPMVPGIITADDLCPAECVGYATFAEQPTIFDIIEGDDDVNYYNFISNTALSCPSQAIGCEEFTNLDELAAGGEGKEYYTYLRQCVPMAFATTYYTWEGEDVAGYQIRTWTFLKSNLGDDAPCTNVNPGGDICRDEPYNENFATDHMVAACGPDTDDPFDDPVFDPNCREYFDEEGASHYRLQDRVIFASSDCHPYRRTFTGQEYKAIPSLGQSCAAQFAGCRSYTGSAANNLRRLFLDNFERGSYDPWYAQAGTNIDLSNDSLANNGHSMKLTSAAGSMRADRPVDNIQNNKSYQLSWWMKNEGTVDSITVSFYDGAQSIILGQINTVAAGQWHRYEITSSRIVDLSGDITLIFNVTGNGAVYLDNFILKELVDSLSFLKNSWSTPVACDTPFVGAYLGCQAYRDTNGNNYNLKSFTNLCREEVIGCMAAIDTYNSNNPFEQTFNTGYYSEITVPEDRVTYVVPDPNKYCPQVYKGCSALGKPIVDQAEVTILGFDTVYKINDPDNYNQSLCRAEDLYCEAYNSDKGIYYFKNPGTLACAYQEDVNVAGVLVDGWFTVNSIAAGSPEGCNSVYELAPGWAGSCPASKNLCTTFVDPADPIGCDLDGSDPNVDDCRGYYYYDNEKIDQTSCNGQVDRNTGCALVYDANEWNGDHSEVIRLYDTEATYNLNVARNEPVNPVTGDPDHRDANKLVKVKKDRQCAEWLACKSLDVVWNEDDSKYEMICDALDSCTEYSSTSNITQCRRWDSYTTVTKPLTIEEYQSRVTGIDDHLQWSDKEYVGYSIPGLFPLKDLAVYDFATDPNKNDPRLVFDPTEFFPVGVGSCALNPPTEECTVNIEGQDYYGICRNQVCWINPTGSTAHYSPYTLTTRGYAVAPAPFPSSIKNDDIKILKHSYNQANICLTGDPGDDCESGYTKVTYGLGSLINYYGDYEFDNNSANTAMGVCSIVDDPPLSGGVEKEGDPCRPGLNDCGTGGRCETRTKIEEFINWQGICVQPDLSHAVPTDLDRANYYCNQWYPVDQIKGAQSRFNHFTEAGFYNPAGRDVNMCTVTEPYVTQEDRWYCVGTHNNTNCSILAKVPANSKVNTNKVEDYGAFVAGNYLKSGTYDFNSTGLNPNPSEPDVGAPFIQVPGADQIDCGENITTGGEDRCFSTDHMFAASDFGGSVNVPVIIPGDLQQLFDASHQEIEYFIFDEGINASGGLDMSRDNGNSVILAPNNTTRYASWCSTFDLDPCNNNEHQVYIEDWYGGSHCYPGGPRHHRGRRYCNPLNHNYYLQVEATTITIPNCTDTDCSYNPPLLDKGRDCLNNSPYYSNLVATSTPCTIESERNDYPEECFKECIENLIGISNPTACSEYGEVKMNDNNTPSNPADDTVVSVSSCYDNLYFTTSGSPLTKRTGVNDNLIEEVSGYQDPSSPNWVFGCLSSNQNYQPSCTSTTISIPKTDFRNVLYPYESFGTDCLGLECYQQCKIISTIDAEGDNNKSWVRTDIWWRAENANPTANHLYETPKVPWKSYYYDENANVYSNPSNANVLFNSINATSVRDFFGADQDSPGNEIIVTEVALNTDIFGNNRRAATFFSYSDVPDAVVQMRHLFGKLYNLTWNQQAKLYEYLNPSFIEPDSTIDPNPITLAGPDHPPRVLQVCGNEPCLDDATGLVRQGITVNNQNSNVQVVGEEGTLFSAIKFYYHAHPDHMPIIDLQVDWGDGEISGAIPNSKYKNNLPECNPDANVPKVSGLNSKQGFAGTAGACHEGYKTFFHFYSYDEDYFSHRCSYQSGAPNYAEADCYQPTVKVTDNWGEETQYTYAGWLIVYPLEE